MLVRLTDYLACPRCQGPGGLILLAERVEEQRVRSGELGCPSCHARFPIKDSVADFGTGDIEPHDVETHDLVRLAALLGVAEGPALLLLVGEWGDLAGQLAAMLSDVEVIVVQRTLEQQHGEQRVSRLRADARIPLRSAAMHGVALSSRSPVPAQEAARVCRLAARVVLLDVSASAEQLREHGLRIMAQQENTIVAVREH